MAGSLKSCKLAGIDRCGAASPFFEPQASVGGHVLAFAFVAAIKFDLGAPGGIVLDAQVAPGSLNRGRAGIEGGIDMAEFSTRPASFFEWLMLRGLLGQATRDRNPVSTTARAHSGDLQSFEGQWPVNKPSVALKVSKKSNPSSLHVGKAARTSPRQTWTNRYAGR